MIKYEFVDLTRMCVIPANTKKSEQFQRHPKCPKVNVIARLEYELAYYDSADHRFNHYTTRTSPSRVK